MDQGHSPSSLSHSREIWRHAHERRASRLLASHCDSAETSIVEQLSWGGGILQSRGLARVGATRQ